MGIQNADYDAKRRILESLGVAVTIKEGRYYITCVIGKADGDTRKISRKGKVGIVTSSPVGL